MPGIALIPLLCYACASILLALGFLARKKSLGRWGLVFCLAGVAGHTVWVLTLLNSGFFGGRESYLLFLALGLMAVGLLVWWRLKMDTLLLAASPFAFFLLLFVLLNKNTTGAAAETSLYGPVFLLHLGAVFTAFALMAVGAVAGLLFLWQEKAIKKKTPLTEHQKDLPSLALLDKINAFTTRFGFPLFAVGVLLGFVWARLAWGAILTGDAKEVFSLLVLIVYAVLFHQREALGWCGKKPARMAIFVFLLSLFSLLVVNTLFSTHHNLLV